MSKWKTPRELEEDGFVFDPETRRMSKPKGVPKPVLDGEVSGRPPVIDSKAYSGGVRKAGVMNQTETRFYQWVMDGHLIEDEAEEREQLGIKATLYACEYETRNFKLAKKCWFRPDFCVVYHMVAPAVGGGFSGYYKTTAFDVKARWGDKPGVKDDALVKLKIAAEMYRDIGWCMTWPKKGGGWEERWFTHSVTDQRPSRQPPCRREG